MRKEDATRWMKWEYFRYIAVSSATITGNRIINIDAE
jgi:hypothetical protein